MAAQPQRIDGARPRVSWWMSPVTTTCHLLDRVATMVPSASDAVSARCFTRANRVKKAKKTREKAGRAHPCGGLR
jgi:hypothetical protein